MITGMYEPNEDDIGTQAPTRDEEAVEMYLQGIHVADICVELALNPPTLYLILRRASVPIDRRGAHPTGSSQDATPRLLPTLDRPFGVHDPRAIGRPPNLVTEELRTLILHDYETFGSARKVAHLNGLTYWIVLRTLREEGVPLFIGAKKQPRPSITDLAGRPLTTDEVSSIQLGIEAAAADDAVSLEDVALEFGVSLAVLTTIISLGSGPVAVVSKKEKTKAAHAMASVSVADTITAITREVEARVRRDSLVDLQPPLLDV
jgi:hypothetical protein